MKKTPAISEVTCYKQTIVIRDRSARINQMKRTIIYPFFHARRFVVPDLVTIDLFIHTTKPVELSIDTKPMGRGKCLNKISLQPPDPGRSELNRIIWKAI